MLGFNLQPATQELILKLLQQGAEAAYSKAADEANEAAQKAKDEAKAWKDKYDQCFTKVLHYESKVHPTQL